MKLNNEAHDLANSDRHVIRTAIPIGALPDINMTYQRLTTKTPYIYRLQRIVTDKPSIPDVAGQQEPFALALYHYTNL